MLNLHHRQRLAVHTWSSGRRRHSTRSRRQRQHTVSCQAGHSTVIIVGAGVIGLCCAKALLQDSDASVLMLEASGLCSGATGAGQGYLWLAHRKPDCAAWSLAVNSKSIWARWQTESPNFSLASGWQDTGSILMGHSPREQRELKARHALLVGAGISAQLLDTVELKAAEPALACRATSVGLLVRSDAQLDGRQAAAELLRQCQQYSARFEVRMGQPVEKILRHPADGHILGVACHSARILADHVVVAAGAWSGNLLARTCSDASWKERLIARRGHLLELQPPDGMPTVSHGLMESEYTQHYAVSPAAVPADDAGAEVTFTATTSASGTLLLGSSREFAGWDTQPSAAIIAAILDRAGQYLPHLQGLPPSTVQSVRVGLRPFCADMQPVIGPVPGSAGLYVAAGHEGSGLMLGPATGELLAQCILHPQAERNSFPEFLP